MKNNLIGVTKFPDKDGNYTVITTRREVMIIWHTAEEIQVVGRAKPSDKESWIRQMISKHQESRGVVSMSACEQLAQRIADFLKLVGQTSEKDINETVIRNLPIPTQNAFDACKQKVLALLNQP